MPAVLATFESILHYLGLFAGLGTLAYSISRAVIAHSRLTGQETGAAHKVLRTPYLLIATVLFFFLAYVLFVPLPIRLAWLWSLVATILGAAILFASLGLYLWGLHALGNNFNFSSGFGVRLQETHHLVTQGPFAIVRHPMYLAVILAFWGGLFLYRTWTMLLFVVMMFGLVYRASKEDEALSQAFGAEWENYRRSVPAWIPRITHRNSTLS